MKFSIGIDLGGTKLAVALINENGKILVFHKESILEIKSDPVPKRAQTKVVQRMASLVQEIRETHPTAFQKKNFIGVGLASAGPLNVTKGELVFPSNFPGWKIVSIKKMLEKELAKIKIKTKVSFQNDAIAAAIAEGWIGHAKNLKTYAVITIGTGIGSGVIFQGKPLQTFGMGSEFGHLICDQKQILNFEQDLHPNTVEGIASGTGLLLRAKKMGFQGQSIEDLVALIQSGENQYLQLFDEAADALASLCFNLSVGLNVEKFLFSGGLIKIRKYYFERMKLRYQKLIRVMNPQFECSLQVAKCLNQAGVIGAARLPYL